MPKEETIEMRHVRSVIGEKDDLPGLSPRVSLSSKIWALLLKSFGVPQLIHRYGALELNKTLTLDAGEDNVTSLFTDGVYMYAGLDTTPGKVVKIDLATFATISTLTFGAGNNSVRALFSDGTYLYAGLHIDPGVVVKIDLATFTQVSTLTFAAGEGFVTSLFSDGTFLYAGLASFPGKIVKVSLDTFTTVSTLTFAAGEDKIWALASDGSYLYAALNVDPGKVVKVDLGSFTFVATFTFTAGAGYSWSSVLFTDGMYLYVGLNTSLGMLARIDLSTFTQTSILTFNVGEDNVRSIFSDGTYLYVGLDVGPGKVVKVDQATFALVNTLTFDAGESFVRALFSDGTYLYAGLYSSPGKLIRKYIIPSSDLYQKKIDMIYEHSYQRTYGVYPSLAVGTLLTSNAAAWTSGNYTEVIPADTISRTFYITGIILYNLTAGVEYEVRIATGAALSEVPIAVVVHQTDNANLAHECLFPVSIKVAALTRISAKCADSTGGLTCRVKIRYRSA